MRTFTKSPVTEEFDSKNPKRYLMEKGANVDFAMFDLELQTQNFASYRQSELDNPRIGTFTQIQVNSILQIDMR